MIYCRKLFWLLLLVIPAGCATPPPAPTPPDVDLSPEPALVVKPAAPISPIPKQVVPAPHVVVASAPPAPVINDHIEPNEIWVPLERWCRASGFGAPRRIANEPAPTYAFALTNGTMILRIGSELATWRGADYHLGFAPHIIDGQPYLHALDIRKNLLPLVENPVRPEANRVIVIDPGHGGSDSGASNVVNGRFEKEFTLDLARRLQALLNASGWTALLTRTNDTFVPLPDRVAFAEQHKAGLFISLHFNSAFPDRQEYGLETYCMTPHGMHSTLTRGFADNPALTFPNNHFDEENLRYAACIHRELLKVNGHVDRGVRRARFLGVLQGQNRPALLVEGGFLSNPSEARKIADPAYRQKIAEAITHALNEEAGSPVNVAMRQKPAALPSSPMPLSVTMKEQKATNGLSGSMTNASVSRQQGEGND